MTAIDLAIKTMGWTDPRMVQDARRVAEGYSFASFGANGECFLTSHQVSHFRSVLIGVQAGMALNVSRMTKALEETDPEFDPDWDYEPQARAIVGLT